MSTERSPLLKEMDGLLFKARMEGGFVETIELIKGAIRAQEESEMELDRQSRAILKRTEPK